MRKIRLIIILIASLSLVPLFAAAQEIVKSEVIEFQDGKGYYMHSVLQGQTLYSLSKVYDVPVDELIFENPDAANSLSVGQLIRIPVKSRERIITDDLRKGEFRYIFHIVKKGQTLYGISRIYQVEVDELKKANPGWAKGLKAGQYLRIPMKDPVLREEDQVFDEEAAAGVHTVKAGETLYSISRLYHVSISALKAINKGAATELKVGQQIMIPDKKLPQEETKEQARYFEHTVAGKETLYSIARRYRTSIDSLKSFNPGLTEYIHPGEVIRIPAKVNPESFITHRVVEKTKLKKIASRYALSVSAMKTANPNIGNRLYPGELLKVPVGPPPHTEDDGVTLLVKAEEPAVPQPIESDSLRCLRRKGDRDKEFRVALMIPLYTEAVREIDLQNTDKALDPASYKPFNFVQFYEGFLMALDDMRAEGMNLKIYVYDVDEKVSKTIRVLQQAELKSMDLIIGPFFSRNFKLVSNFAEMFDIKIVNPLTRRTEVLNNPNVFKMKPSRDTQAALLEKFVEQYYPGSNVILVRNNKYRFGNEVSEIRSRLEKVLPYGVQISNSNIYETLKDYSEADTNLAPGTLYSSITVENREISTEYLENNLADSTFFTNGISEVIYAADSVGGIIRNASISRNNLIVVLAESEIFAPEILTRLNDLKDTFDITLVGMPEWELFTNLETDYLLDLKVYFFSDSYYDYDDPDVDAFVNAFRERFKTQPNQYAFEAYDLANYFLGAMARFGNHCKDCLPFYRADLLKSSYQLKKAYPSGFENVYWNLCRYRNYRIYKLPDLN